MATAVHVGALWRAAVVVEFVAGVRGRSSGGVEWIARVLGRLQARVEGAGGARGDGSVVAVLGCLGGIPPSSLEAREGRRQGEKAAGPARWASPRRQVRFSIFSV